MLLQRLQVARVSPLREAWARDNVYFAHAEVVKCLKINASFKKKEKKKAVQAYSCPHVTVTKLKGSAILHEGKSSFSFVNFLYFFSFYFLNRGNDFNFFYFIIHLLGNFWKNKNKKLIIYTFFNFIFVLFMYNFLNLI